jgi:hypothetical protein
MATTVDHQGAPERSAADLREQAPLRAAACERLLELDIPKRKLILAGDKERLLHPVSLRSSGLQSQGVH